MGLNLYDVRSRSRNVQKSDEDFLAWLYGGQVRNFEGGSTLSAKCPLLSFVGSYHGLSNLYC